MTRRVSDRAEDFFGSRSINRAVSAGLVLLVHVAILAVLLHSRQPYGFPQPRETILRLLPILQSAEPVPPHYEAPKPLHRETAPIFVPHIETPPSASATQPDITSLGEALNNCSLENLDKLTPEQRTRCAAYRNAVPGAMARTQPGLNVPSHSIDAALWAEAIKQRNTPTKVDCANVASQVAGVQGNTQSIGVMVNVPCVLRHLIQRQSPIH